MASFAVQVKQFADKTKKRQDQAVRKIILDVYSGIVHKNPVDTGQTQNNWNIGLNNVDPSITEEAIKNSQTIIGQALQVIKQIKAGNVIYISNNLPWVRLLEFGGYPGGGPRTTPEGFSRQAPNGMLRLTLREYPAIVTNGVEEAKRQHP